MSTCSDHVPISYDYTMLPVISTERGEYRLRLLPTHSFNRDEWDLPDNMTVLATPTRQSTMRSRHSFEFQTPRSSAILQMVQNLLESPATRAPL